MRILAGKARGRKIAAPTGRRTRPTLQVVRKSIFDTLGNRVAGARVLDLFSGAGTLGLESLSRGSKAATFVEVDVATIRILEKNVSELSFAEQCTLVHGDALTVLLSSCRKGVKYDIVFADPPYGSESAAQLIEAFRRCDILQPLGILVVEHAKPAAFPSQMGLLTLWKTREFGETRVSFYQKGKESS